jgi:hypothetical protein
MYSEDLKKYSQHTADLISLTENALTSRDIEDILSRDIKTDKSLFASPDAQTAKRLRELGYTSGKIPQILDFKKLLGSTEFPRVMRDMLATLSAAYDYPVDIEFTANFSKDGRFRINLLQCRPLQTGGLGKAVKLPKIDDSADCIFLTKGGFMGGNVHLLLDYIVIVRPREYRLLSERDKYETARHIGLINASLKGKTVMLIGPGRWGTTTPSLGVPVHFSELSNMSVICEVSSAEAGFMPELSYGSHFFQDLVESGIFYAAIMDGQKDVVYNPDKILRRENLLTSVSPGSEAFSDVIHIAASGGAELYSDIVSQTLLCI